MDIGTLRRKIAFVDVEASGVMPGSFPVEVAWRTAEGDGEVLINPAGVWDEDRWDPDAEAMHGLTVAHLKRRGRSPVHAAATLEKVFKDRLVFSDSPAHDVQWLDMLHAAARIPRTYRVETVGRLLGHIGLRAAEAYRIFEKARETHPPRGRARAGVAHLAAVFDRAAAEALKS